MADDDINVAKNLLKSKDYLWMGFICHLIAEKALKAVVADITEEIPPKTHDLPRLATIANVRPALSTQQLKLLNDLTPLQIEARYPEHKAKIAATLTLQRSEELMKETEVFVCWIKNWLGK